MASKADVYKAVGRYQRALESIGIAGAATIVWGSNPNGVRHVLEFRSPDLQHPEVESIGRTYKDAENFIDAMSAAIEFAARAMKRRNVIGTIFMDVGGRERVVRDLPQDGAKVKCLGCGLDDVLVESGGYLKNHRRKAGRNRCNGSGRHVRFNVAGQLSGV